MYPYKEEPQVDVVDTVFQAYDDGILTEGELVLHLVRALTTDNIKQIYWRLRENGYGPFSAADFDNWLVSLYQGAEFLWGGISETLSEEAQEAILQQHPSLRR